MAVRKIADMEFDGVSYTDAGVDAAHICYQDEWLGLRVGDKLPSGKIVQLCTHPESCCAWAVVQSKGAMYEIDLPYHGDET